jgi:hypothetical protein
VIQAFGQHLDGKGHVEVVSARLGEVSPMRSKVKSWRVQAIRKRPAPASHGRPAK